MFTQHSQSSALATASESESNNLGIRLEGMDFWIGGVPRGSSEALVSALQDFYTPRRPIDVGGSIELERRRGNLGFKARTAPEPFDRFRMTELQNKVIDIKDAAFGENGELGLERIAIRGYFHSPASLAEIDLHRITPSRRRDISRAGVEPISFTYGSPSSGRQVKVSVVGGKHAPHQSHDVYPWLEENPYYQEDRQVLTVELVFNLPLIRKLTPGSKGDEDYPNLPHLLSNLVRVTLGDETHPASFFRAATPESEHLFPASLRPNNPAWDNIRRAILEEVSGPTAKANVPDTKPGNTLGRRLLGVFSGETRGSS